MSSNIIQDLPKIELHRHIEGSFHPPTLFQIAQKNRLDFPQEFEAFKEQLQFPKDSKPDFALFLSKFYNKWYNDLDDVYTVVYNSFLNIDQNENLFYSEIRFNPFHFCINKGFDPVDTLKTFLMAARSAIREKQSHTKLLMTINRGFYPEERYMEVFKQFVDKVDLTGIIGIDLAGDEVNFPPEKFQHFFQLIQSHGLPATIHAGEVTSADQIWTAIDKLHAKRIGHGVKVTDDPNLIAYAKEKSIAFEMCPISNYQTGAVPDTANHPIRDLLREGLCVTLNSDDPTVQNATLVDDYNACHHQMGLSIDELKALNLNSIQASFLPPKEKIDLEKNFLQAWGKVTSAH
ncbi:adenosine deaminase [Entomospira culicis]|uniref:Adenosine deaminase n=1 Tax=Entomospira culicis TaxID=2719989 RepID=A0A968GDN6_9SPIO|nr:adenosine deaminase [Entomospira culicis]NIZ18412.1 adenosine deaminase [Entomospira culicis]NIZ68628.1 adenosine deaminase [Entomospira culicis]WDI37228.1 adenosine deaminase [Entomospira culicis]WDI38856.1 adenosine deaminase [Entomospira culicis]